MNFRKALRLVMFDCLSLVSLVFPLVLYFIQSFCAFKKRVKPRPLQRGDLVLRILRGLAGDPRRKFRPTWSGPYIIRELTPEGAAWLIDLDGNQFLEPTNVDQLKKYYV